MPRVFNKRSGDAPKDAVYVGRPSPFGNPFPIDGLHSREQVVANFERWIFTQPQLIAKVKAELRGKDLVCWCAPQLCHADILLRIANEDCA